MKTIITNSLSKMRRIFGHTKDIDSKFEEIDDLYTIKSKLDELNKIISLSAKDTIRQIEALNYLSNHISYKYPPPYSGGWAASPDFLLYIYEVIILSKPSTVVELGSGLSSLVICKALEKNGNGKLISVDHELSYLNKTKKYIYNEELDKYIEFIYAPIGNTEEMYLHWYDINALSEIKLVDLLVVDGPPKNTANMARYPAVPFFYSKLSESSVILLDDAKRLDEKNIFEQWVSEFNFKQFYIEADFQKGLAVLIK